MSVEQLLAQLVRIPSPNPPGDTQAIANLVGGLLRDAGFEVQLLAPPEKPAAVSVVASIGPDDGPSLLYHAHTDTVPIGANEQWTMSPYAAEVHNGRLYGKGSVDDKAPLAAMLDVGLALAEHAQALRGRLTIVAAAEEETGGQLGTAWLARTGHLPPSDFIVVGEQTHNRVAIAHKGVLRATVRTYGRSVHATNPDRGVNAINAMARIILALEQYHARLQERRHPLVGCPSLNIGVIEGGATANAVADSCRITLDRRMVPPERPEKIMTELEAVVASATIAPARAEVGDYLVSNWFESTADNPYTARLIDLCAELCGAPREPVGYLPGSDAKHLVDLARVGMVVFGPGSYEVAHAADEYVDLVELAQTSQVLRRLAFEFLLGQGLYER